MVVTRPKSTGETGLMVTEAMIAGRFPLLVGLNRRDWLDICLAQVSYRAVRV